MNPSLASKRSGKWKHTGRPTALRRGRKELRNIGRLAASVPVELYPPSTPRKAKPSTRARARARTGQVWLLVLKLAKQAVSLYALRQLQASGTVGLKGRGFGKFFQAQEFKPQDPPVFIKGEITAGRDL